MVGDKRLRGSEPDDYSSGWDRHMNPASPTLFLDHLPPAVTLEEIEPLFKNIPGFLGIKLGNKKLDEGEFRTCSVEFSAVEHAISARKALQNYQAPSWETSVVINYARPKHQPGSGGRGLPPGYPAQPGLLSPPFATPTNMGSLQGIGPSLRTPWLGATAHGRAQAPLMDSPLAFGDLRAGLLQRHPSSITGQLPLASAAMSLPGGGSGISLGMYPQMIASGGLQGLHSPLRNQLAEGGGGVLLRGGISEGGTCSSPGGMHAAHPPDRLGNPASRRLFLSNLAPGVTEAQLRELYPSAEKIGLSRKQLAEGEPRSGFVHFRDVDTAVVERARTKGTKPSWQNAPLLINYMRGDKDVDRAGMWPGAMGHGQGAGTAGMGMGLFGSVLQGRQTLGASRYPGTHYSPGIGHQTPMGAVDSAGNPPSTMLFLDHMPQHVTEAEVADIFKVFEGFRNVRLGNKELKPGEWRTGTVNFTSIPCAVAARNATVGRR
eukprot:jgi/Mesvir1/20976/Mv08042-RA.1